jgi:hypothetical protein
MSWLRLLDTSNGRNIALVCVVSRQIWMPKGFSLSHPLANDAPVILDSICLCADPATKTPDLSMEVSYATPRGLGIGQFIVSGAE